MTKGDPKRHAERLFHEIADLPLAERAAHLDAHCPDPALRREVEELLAHADASAQTGFESACGTTIAS